MPSPTHTHGRPATMRATSSSAADDCNPPTTSAPASEPPVGVESAREVWACAAAAATVLASSPVASDSERAKVAYRGGSARLSAWHAPLVSVTEGAPAGKRSPSATSCLASTAGGSAAVQPNAPHNCCREAEVDCGIAAASTSPSTALHAHMSSTGRTRSGAMTAGLNSGTAVTRAPPGHGSSGCGGLSSTGTHARWRSASTTEPSPAAASLTCSCCRSELPPPPAPTPPRRRSRCVARARSSLRCC